MAKTYRCRVTAQGGLTLPASLHKGLVRAGIGGFSAGVQDGRAVLQPRHQSVLAVARLSPFLALMEAELLHAEALVKDDFGEMAAKAFPVRLDTPVLGPVPV